ncbi:MAG: hypothetical protein OEM02_02305, partial [Desulfobulbaceae bacterium]|nr:hypothetical protein [Desulfobulbaceae bacterium]
HRELQIRPHLVQTPLDLFGIAIRVLTGDNLLTPLPGIQSFLPHASVSGIGSRDDWLNQPHASLPLARRRRRSRHHTSTLTFRNNTINIHTKPPDTTCKPFRLHRKRNMPRRRILR